MSLKKTLSSIDLFHLVGELDFLMGAKIEQIYQKGKDDLLIQFHIPSKGKKFLRIVVGELMYLSDEKGNIPERPPQFCMYLRKALKNSRLRSINQLGSERIIELVFENKDRIAKLIFEFITPGNIILTKEDGVILAVLEIQKWKSRILRPKVEYVYPKREFDAFTSERAELKKLLEESDKENLVKSLAIDAGLGGKYAEEVCLNTGMDKNSVPKTLNDKEISAVLESMRNLTTTKREATLVYDGENLKDIIPIPLNIYKNFKRVQKDSFNAALDEVHTQHVEKEVKDLITKSAKTKRGKVEERIRLQTNRVKGLEESEVDNQKKGELIYEKYSVVDDLLKQINEARKKLSWKEIKEKLKGHKMIKKIDEKTGDIVIEL